jgi:hypothetical protein
VEFAPDVRWRRSQRGLVIGSDAGEAVLLEHPRAGQLPDMLDDRPDRASLAARLGPPNAVSLVEEMAEVGLLVDDDRTPTIGLPEAPSGPRPRRVVLTRSGLEFPGIASPAGWIERWLSPVWMSWPGRVVLLVLTAGGIAALISGRPAGPTVSAHPWMDALLGFTIALICDALHELAHAVSLVHYGRRPRRAGFGFYWGGVSFYVDSTEALTLPRRARVTQALVGLGVDVVTTSVLAIAAHVVAFAAEGPAGAAVGAVLAWSVAWRVAVLGALGIVLNALPILQVDGHWALADLLDEPDLAARARAALGDGLRHVVRGTTRPSRDRTPTTAASESHADAPDRPGPRWLLGYGVVSTLGGLLALATTVPVWWFAAGDLVRALFAGNPAEIVIGTVLVGPFVLSLLASTVGLVLETLPENGPDDDRSRSTAPATS